MNTYIKLGVLLTSFFIASFAHAASIPGNITVLEASDTSLSLDWEDVDGVLGYYIYYGESSGIGALYDVEGVDLIEQSDFMLSDLRAGTKYFIAITSVDEFGSESEYSPELEYETLSSGSEVSAASFRLVDVTPIDDISIEINFSVDLDTSPGAQRQFILENVGTGEEVSIDISDLLPGDPSKVVAVLGGRLLSNTQYKLTVLEISDSMGNSIESGIDAFSDFTTPLNFSGDLQSAAENPPSEEDNTVVQEESITPTNSSQEEKTSQVATQDPISNEPNQLNAAASLEGNNAGTTISTAELSKNTSVAAQNNEKLPQTGPEHILLALIAMIFGAGFVYMRSAKKQES